MPALRVAAAAAALAAGSQTAHAFVEVGTIAGNDIFTDSTTTASSWYWDGANITISSETSAGASNEYAIWIFSGTNDTNLLTISSGAVLSGGTIGIGNFGTINTLNNAGTIVGLTSYGLLNEGTIDTVTNSGRIYTNTSNNAIRNTGNIGTLTNTGIISSSQDALYNTGSIGTLDNTKTITGAANYGIYNDGTISDLINSGVISNSGTTTGDAALYNAGTIGALSNSGTISGNIAFDNATSSAIMSLTNSGTISGSHTGIYNNGSIGTLTNTGTLESADFALDNESSGSIGTFVNAGVVAGSIVNLSSNALTIDGGTGTLFGTLTGYDGVTGSISNTASDLNFGSGNLLLNDNINVSTHTVNNLGATLEVDGIVNITGNYSQSAAATLLIGVTDSATATGSESDTGYGRLVVSGNTTIASGSSIELKSATGNYSFAAGQRYVVVVAEGVGTYNVTSLNYAIAGYSAATLTGSTVTSGSDTDLVVTVDSLSGSSTTTTTTTTTTSSPAPTSYATVANAPNAVSALTGLLSYTGVNSAALLNLYDATLASLETGSASTANHIGKQLAPVQAQASSAASTLDALNVVSAHADSLRLGSIDGAGGTSGIATGDGPMAWTAWGQVFGGHASQSERDDVDGYSANYGGLLLGADRAFGDHWRIGGAFDYAHTAIDAADDTAGDSAGINAYGLIGYASYVGSPWYLNLSGAATLQHADTTRIVTMTGYQGIATGSFAGQQYVARAEAGWPLRVAGTTLTPLLSFTYSHLNQEGYTESGGNGAALEVGGSNLNSVRSGLGAKFSQSFAISYGALTPEIGVQWIHEFDRARELTTASFAAAPSETGFTTVGATPAANLADLSVGVTLLRASNLSLTARYELEAGSGFVSNAGVLRLQQRF